MVLQKRLDYGFNGYQVPATPRATRSVRRRVPFGLKVEEKQMCAFDLLATVAGKLLSEGKNVPTEMALVGEDQLTEDEMKCSKELSNQVISGNRFRLAENTSKENNGNHKLNESPNLHNDACSGLASDITTSDCSEKVANAEKSAIGRGTNGNENSIVMIDVQSPDRDHKLDNEFKRKTKLEQVLSGNGVSMSHSGEPTVLDAKPPAPVNRDGVPNVPLHRDHGRRYFSSPCRDVKVGSRDDDENSSGSTRPSSTMKFSRSLSCIRDRRIKKLLSSKYWKVSANPKDEEVSNTDGELNTVFSYRRNCYKRQRSQRIYPFKKRKCFHRCPGGTNRDGIYRSLDKDIKGNPFGSVPRMQSQVNKMSSAGEGQTTASHSENSHVKLRIKSIKVPELFIEIPETATIGSLKRTVLEAMTTILGGGLHVGVLFQGKKVRDDNKTLLQTGISHDDQLDALGFTLEANSSRIAPSMSAEQSPFLLSSDAAQTLTRYPSPSNINHQGSSIALRGEENSDLRNFVDSDHDSAPTPTNALPGKSAGNSKALVAVPSMSFEALTVVPANRKSKRSEATQRRIRRPFSVHEVEALVQAVEKLGTGRWRDVKLQAFDNAKHRTYVDLKDKWKTLVHTARISPQQRRGEPVPQVLLDRVLAAHAYWSQQQAKQQSKHQPETCLLLP